MSAQDQHTRELLRRWISGELNAREEAELLAAAEYDVFLREALAAYQGQAEVDHAAALARLRRGAASGAEGAVVRPIRRWIGVAASLLLLLAAGWWLRDAQPKDTTGAVAMEVQAAPETEETLTAPPSPPTASDALVEEAAEPIAQAEPAPIVREPAPTTQKRRPPSPSPPPPAVTADQELILTESESKDQIAERSDRAEAEADRRADEVQKMEAEESVAEWLKQNPPPPPAPIDPSTYYSDTGYVKRARQPSTISNSGVTVPSEGFRVISGKVRDPEGYPLIGATILEPGTANGTVTDIDGYFQITVAENSENLIVSYTGFDTSDILLDMQENDLEIALSESSATLDEIVVTGLNRDQTYTDDEGPATARPTVGFRDLRRYLEENAPVNTPRARVKIRFFVQADGTITNSTVLRSTNIGQNDLAIELLENGPAWEITNGTAPVEVVYTVKFR